MMNRYSTSADAIDRAIAPALTEGQFDMDAIFRETFVWAVDTDAEGNELLNTAGFEQTVTGEDFWASVSRHEIS